MSFVFSFPDRWSWKSIVESSESKDEVSVIEAREVSLKESTVNEDYLSVVACRTTVQPHSTLVQLTWISTAVLKIIIIIHREKMSIGHIFTEYHLLFAWLLKTQKQNDLRLHRKIGSSQKIHSTPWDERQTATKSVVKLQTTKIMINNKSGSNIINNNNDNRNNNLPNILNCYPNALSIQHRRRPFMLSTLLSLHWLILSTTWPCSLRPLQYGASQTARRFSIGRFLVITWRSLARAQRAKLEIRSAVRLAATCCFVRSARVKLQSHYQQISNPPVFQGQQTAATKVNWT